MLKRQEFLEDWDEPPKPFVWTGAAESILAKLPRCRQTLEKVWPGSTWLRSRKKKQNTGQYLSSYFADTTLVTAHTRSYSLPFSILHHPEQSSAL